MKHIKIILHLFLGSIVFLQLSAQERMDIPVQIGEELVMPWNGGFNAPQFSNIDLNRDGVLDMISFDRQGDILRTYIRLPDSGRWILDWSYISFFPALVDWVLVADFNKDGIEDLFTSSSPTGVAGVTVYKGAYDNGVWSFTKQTDRGKDYLQVISGGGLTNLYVAWDDLPAIKDIDGDGDLDILAYEPGGSFISYFSNQSIENGWGKDSIRYILKDICWGKILENQFSEEVYLSDNPDVCSDGNYTSEEHILPRHAGSTILTMDIDEDGDQDAFVGDISSGRIVFMLNGLTAQEAWIIAQDAHYPSTDTSIAIPYFVGAFGVQVDDDPELELLAAVNSRSLTEDKVSVWRYDDDPAAGPLDFKLTDKGFFQKDMIDGGSQSHPAIADVNGDGLQDVIMGVFKFVNGTDYTRFPSLWLFENQGTPTQPYFVKVNEDYLGMSQYGIVSPFDFEYSPAFGDIDGNGTIDLVVGDQNGKLFFYKNSSLPGTAMTFETPVYPYMNINVGVAATPQIVDINGDGLGDLIVGERTGNADNNGRCSNLNYFENIGSVGSALFSADVNVAPNTQCFGRLLFDLQPGLPQYSTPSIFRTNEGLMLLTGSDPGKLELYDDVQNGKTGAIPLLDDYYLSIDAGNRSAPALGDLNGDGLYELVVGNQRGGLELFSTGLVVGFTSVIHPEDLVVKPYSLNTIVADNRVEVFWKNNEPGQIELFNVYGASLQLKSETQDALQRLNFQNFPSGIYFLQLRQGGFSWVEKIIKQN